MTSPPDDILDLLTAYALGALEPDEIVRVGALLDQQPELRATLAELRATADMLPYGLPEATPPTDLRQRALDHATGRASSAAPTPRERLSTRARGWIWALSGVVSLALLAAAIGWGQLLSTSSQIGQLQSELASVRAELKDTQTQVAAAQQQANQLQAQIASAQKVLASLQGENGSGAILQAKNGTTVFAAQLPPLKPGHVYQLWRIQSGSAPTSLGIFTVDLQGYGIKPLTRNQEPQSGETVAVTDEPDGGSSGPTSQPLIAGQTKA
ncbi:MAG TPA: anti-sigma factor [Roseiflexaceae bacterium]|nr:anti-sigma factor [Roseiflexaceae bacterium]